LTTDEIILRLDRAPEEKRLGAVISSFLRAIARWAWWLVPATTALVLALLFQDPFAGDWDALDYTVLAVQGQPSSMVLGRILFVFYNHSLWYVAYNLFAIRPENAYLIFKYAVIFQSPLAIILWWRLSHKLTSSFQAATISVLLLLLSPFFILYSGQVMTEIPSIVLLAIGLTVHLNGLRARRFIAVVIGAAILGISVNVREAGLLYFPWLIVGPYSCGWRLERKEIRTTIMACLIFFVCALGPFLFLLSTNIGNYFWFWHGWLEATRVESARHPISLSDFGPLLRYFLIAAPLVVFAFPLAMWKELKLRGFTPLAALAAVGIVANLLLILHYSLEVNGRYLLTGLPALTPLVGSFLVRSSERIISSRRQAFVCVIAGVLLTALVAGRMGWPFSRTYLEQRALAKDYRNQLAKVPRDAVMISGAQTVAVTYWRGLGAGEWQVISSGSPWPGAALNSEVAERLANGDRVFLDADPRWWLLGDWSRQELPDMINLASDFHFRLVSNTIYEIRPADDETARDLPELIFRLMRSGAKVAPSDRLNTTISEGASGT
jgi:hypothetical protein